MISPLLTGLAGATIGAVLGLLVTRQLSTLTYRLPDEQHLPAPGQRRWIIWTSAVSLGSVTAWLAATNNWPLAPALLPLALTGPALAAIDLDVMRLPNNILLPVAITTLAGLVSTVTSQDGWATTLRGLIGGLITGASFALLHLISRGGIGLGDVKLAGILGTGVGAIAISTPVWSLLLGSISALVWAKASHRGGPIPYGPWLLLGGLLGVLVA